MRLPVLLFLAVSTPCFLSNGAAPGTPLAAAAVASARPPQPPSPPLPKLSAKAEAILAAVRPPEPRQPPPLPKQGASTNATAVLAGWRAALNRNASDYSAMFWLARSLQGSSAGQAQSGACSAQLPPQGGAAGRRGRTQEVRALLDRAAAVAPPCALRSDIQRLRGKALIAEGAAEEAEAAVRGAVELLLEHGSAEGKALDAGAQLIQMSLNLGATAATVRLVAWQVEAARGKDSAAYLSALAISPEGSAEGLYLEMEQCAAWLDAVAEAGPFLPFIKADERQPAARCAWTGSKSGGGHRATLAFSLFRERHARGLHAEAWRALELGNRLQGVSARYAGGSYIRRLEGVAEIFPPNATSEALLAAARVQAAAAAARPAAGLWQRWAGVRRERGGGLRPIFVMGMPRSGTSLLEQVLSSHPLVWGAGETTPLGASVEALVAHIAAWGQIGRARLREMGALYRREMESRLPASKAGARFVVDKGLYNTWNLGYVPLLMPDACILHAVRHPADVALSVHAHQSNPASIPWGFNLADTAHYIASHHAVMDHWRAALPPSSFMTVHYSDMVRDLEGTARKVLVHCGVPWDPVVLSFFHTPRPVYTASREQVRRPIYSSSLGRWTKYGRQLVPVLRTLRVAVEKYEAEARLPSSAGLLARLFAEERGGRGVAGDA